MNVFIIQYHDYNDPCDIYGVYATRKIAEEALQEITMDKNYYDIKEYTVLEEAKKAIQKAKEAYL